MFIQKIREEKKQFWFPGSTVLKIYLVPV